MGNGNSELRDALAAAYESRRVAEANRQAAEARKCAAESRIIAAERALEAEIAHKAQLLDVLKNIQKKGEESKIIMKQMEEHKRGMKRKIDAMLEKNRKILADHEQMVKKSKNLDDQVKRGKILKAKAEWEKLEISRKHDSLKEEMRKKNTIYRAKETFDKLNEFGDSSLTLECTRALVWFVSTDKSASKIDDVNTMTVKKLQDIAFETPEKYLAVSFKMLYRALNEFRWPKPKVPQTYSSWEDGRLKIACLGLSGTGKTTFFKKMMSILGMTSEEISSLKLQQGDWGEQTVEANVVNLDYKSGGHNIPTALIDVPGLNGLKTGSDDELEIYDKVVKYAQDYGLAYMDAIFLLINNRFSDRELKILRRLRPFCKTYIIRNKIDASLDYEQYNDNYNTSFSSKKEFFPVFKNKALKYFNRCNIAPEGTRIEDMVYFVQSNKSGSEKEYDFPKLLVDLNMFLRERLSNPKQIDPVEHAVQMSKVPGKSNRERELMKQTFQ